MASRILKLPEVRERVPFSRTTIYNKIKLGEFPAPVRLSTRAVGWLEDSVDAWIASRLAANTEASTLKTS